MAISNIIASGIGFSPGSIKFIPTRGFIAAAVIPKPIAGGGMLSAKHVRRSMRRGRGR